MIRVVTGNLGSGKTYYCVNYLRTFATYMPLYEHMVLDPSVLLVTNIDSVKVQHASYDDFRAAGLMDVERLKKYIEEKGYKRVVVIIDECQRYFAGLKDPQEFFFFEYSRHLGLDIFLIVQSVTALPRRLVELAEFVVEAQPRNLRVVGFRYFLRDSKTGQKLSVQGVKTDKKVFKMYKSFDAEESSRPQKTQLVKIVVAASVIIMVLLGANLALRHAFSADMKKVAPGKKSEKAKIVKREKSEGREIVSIRDLGPWIQRNGRAGVRPNKNIAGVIEIENHDGSYETILIPRVDDQARSTDKGGASERGEENQKKLLQ